MAWRRRIDGQLNIISENLRKWRIERNLSQAQLAKKMNILGIPMHKNDISNIEQKKRSARDYEIWGIIKILDITSDDLYEGAESFFNNIEDK